MRFLLVALMALALAACDLGASSPSAEPLPSVGMESGAPASSMDDDDDDDASAGASASSATGMTCEEAFAALDVASIAGMATLDAASDLLDDTIGSCASVVDWQAQVTAIAPSLSVENAESFIDARCEANDLIDDSPICEEVDD